MTCAKKKKKKNALEDEDEEEEELRFTVVSLSNKNQEVLQYYEREKETGTNIGQHSSARSVLDVVDCAWRAIRLLTM